ncbi:MAG: hypothetical protein AYK18_11080 [Theionarchaea archaeon DG-70]|nr:MAG: hypothetical protein AYK18_11080 [Theionarchaea archaeon DG-70]
MMKKAVAIVIACIIGMNCISIAFLAIMGEEGHSKTDEPLFVVRITFQSQEELGQLQNSGFGILEIGEDYVLAMVSLSQFDMLLESGFQMKVVSIKCDTEEIPPSGEIREQEVSEQDVRPGGEEGRIGGYQQIKGNQYYECGGDVKPSPIYTDGVMLSEGNSSGWTKYRFFLPLNSCFIFADVGIFGQDTAPLGTGADVYVYNWVDDTWDYVGNSGKEEKLSTWAINIETHISPAYKNLCIWVFADALDCYHIDHLDTYHTYETPEWTIMAYMNGDNDLDCALVDDINEMESAGSKITYPGINIVVQIDRYSTGDWTTTRRYFICKDKGGYNDTIVSTMISDKGELNMGDPNTLIDFVNWAKSMYPAKNYMLIIVDHGNGWRMRGDLPPAIRAVSFDETNQDAITMPELRQALDVVTYGGSNKFEIIGFDACLMATIEVDYDICPYGDYRVASEETEPFDGWDYEASMGALVANPIMSPSELASQIANDYVLFYILQGIHDKTMAAVDLSMTPALVSAVDTLAGNLESKVSLYKSQLRTIKDNVEHYDSNGDLSSNQYDYYVDLYHFCELVRTHISDPTIRNDALCVMNTLSNTVINSKSGTQKPHAHGISIYYVDKRYNVYTHDYEKLVFFPAATRWDEFLKGFAYPQFSELPSLFAYNSFHVVGDGAYSTDVLGTANLSWIFGRRNMGRPEGRTHTILQDIEHDSGNLLVTGGPAINPVADEFDVEFGISYDYQPGTSFTIFCEEQSITLSLSEYPQKDIAIVYLGVHSDRHILLSWGFGWQGTYAATVLMSHPDLWTFYEDEHFLFVQWEDAHPYEGIVDWDEIQVTYPYPHTLPAPPPGDWFLYDPTFGYMSYLFGGNGFHVVGDQAYCTDVLGTANVSWVFGKYYMERPEGRTHTILQDIEHNSGNLLITGGPAVNPVADEFDQYFNISYVYQPNQPDPFFEISSDGYTLRLDLDDYPYKDICIIHLGRQSSRNVLLVWGFGWEGTYAGTLVVADSSFWSTYSGYHMLLLEWIDTNLDGLVQLSEVSVKYAAYGPHIV